MTLIVNLFIAWFLLVIMFGHRTSPSMFAFLLRPFARLIDGLGLRQHWAMFAPDPTDREARLYAVLQLQSGGARRWDPQNVSGSRTSAWLGFRRRLFELTLGNVDASEARRALAGYLARTYGPAGDPVVAVTFVATLRRHAPWADGAGPPEEETVEAIRIAHVDGVPPRHH